MKLRHLVLSSLLLILPWVQGCTSPTPVPPKTSCCASCCVCCRNVRPCKKPPINSEKQTNVVNEEPNDDPFEDVNRALLCANDALDEVLFDRITAMYRGVVPEYVRQRISYFLRNLGEPVVLVNNILQGDVEGADNTLARFVANSTVGLAGMFDVATDLDIPYKSQDFGLTLASWGVDPGPYMILPLLGPCNLRDAAGKVCDLACDPITWVGVYGPHRTGTQVLDAKSENLELISDLKGNAVDYYASIKSWYCERRKDLGQNVEDRTAVDTPRPDDDD